MKPISLLFAFLLSFSLASAQTNFTNANGNNDWSDPGNWSAGIPTSLVGVFVFSSATIPTGYAAEALYVLGAGTLTISSGASLTMGDGTGNPTNSVVGGTGFTIDNSGLLDITTPSTESAAIAWSGGGLTNHATGVVNIDNITGDGIDLPEIITNEGYINIGVNIGGNAIELGSLGTYTNLAGGQINILGGADGIIEESNGAVTITNDGTICINNANMTGTPIHANVIIAGSGTLGTSGCVATQPSMGAIPTLSEWAMIILALVMGVMATLVLQARVAVQGSGFRVQGLPLAIRHVPFDGRQFAKILAIVLGAVIALFAISIAAFGYEMTNADLPGALVSVPVAAYLIHLWRK